jgi:hypothetical protein
MVVDCIQFDGTNIAAVEEFTGSNNIDIPWNDRYVPRLWVEKLKAWIKLVVGMWIMKEADGSGFYPCTDEAFIAGYERVES